MSGETGYFQVARFESGRQALHVYVQAQETVRGSNCDLSVYRFLYQDISFVAILGATPEQEISTRLAQILSVGTAAVLPAEVIDHLHKRRHRAKRIGPWFEGHYR